MLCCEYLELTLLGELINVFRFFLRQRRRSARRNARSANGCRCFRSDTPNCWAKCGVCVRGEFLYFLGWIRIPVEPSRMNILPLSMARCRCYRRDTPNCWAKCGVCVRGGFLYFLGHTYIYTYTHTCMHTCIHACIHKHTHHTHTHIPKEQNTELRTSPVPMLIRNLCGPL